MTGFDVEVGKAVKRVDGRWPHYSGLISNHLVRIDAFLEPWYHTGIDRQHVEGTPLSDEGQEHQPKDRADEEPKNCAHPSGSLIRLEDGVQAALRDYRTPQGYRTPGVDSRSMKEIHLSSPILNREPTVFSDRREPFSGVIPCRGFVWR
mgnify:CR=1 FL=1